MTFIRTKVGLNRTKEQVSIAMSKKQLLEDVAAEVIVCTKCPLSKSRKNAVPGVGNPEAHIMLIGEAPGRCEDAKGEPFVGSAGKLLDMLLSQIGLTREEVFITNIVKCRPPRNREPKLLEIEACAPYLDRQMLTIRPEFIVTLGSHSTARIFLKATLPFSTITGTRGKLRKASMLGLPVTIVPTYHPASALYNPENKKVLEHDFQLLKRKLRSSRSGSHKR